MTTDCFKLSYLIMISTLLAASTTTEVQQGADAISKSAEVQEPGIPESRALFSPRVDYNEWMPVGRGDPLKKDPTYDYSPPTLDRVHYWGDNNKEKKEILLLGVTSKRQNHRKEPKFQNSIRRSYYAQLPTRLMPPPLQTIAPPKTSATDAHNSYLYSNYKPGNNWSYNDVRSDESVNYVNIARPEGFEKHRPASIIDTNRNTGFRNPWLHELLQKEVTKSNVNITYTVQPSTKMYEAHDVSSVIPFPTTTTTSSPPPTFFQPTIPPNTMTTDSLFSHYKQPVQPLNKAMYLIIEGHSKVKTYGLKDNESEPTTTLQAKIVPVPTKSEVVIKKVVAEDDKGQAVEVKHLHKDGNKDTTVEDPSPMQNLLSFLDTSLGNFFLNEVDTNKTNENFPKMNNSQGEQFPENRQIFDYDLFEESELREKGDSPKDPLNSKKAVEDRLHSTGNT